MTDYRDPRNPDLNPRNPDLNRRWPPVVRGPDAASNSSWAWIAGIVMVVLVLILAFGSGRVANRSATNGANPPATTGQGMAPPAAPAPTSR
jgi:hypothetical protein